MCLSVETVTINIKTCMLPWLGVICKSWSLVAAFTHPTLHESSPKMAVTLKHLLVCCAVGLGPVLAVPAAANQRPVPSILVGRDMLPNFPHDESPYCSFWWDSDGSLTCAGLTQLVGVTKAELTRWVSSLDYITLLSLMLQTHS